MKNIQGISNILRKEISKEEKEIAILKEYDIYAYEIREQAESRLNRQRQPVELIFVNGVDER